MPGRVRGTGNRMMGVKWQPRAGDSKCIMTGASSLLSLSPTRAPSAAYTESGHTDYFSRLEMEDGGQRAWPRQCAVFLCEEGGGGGFDVKFIPPPCPN